MNSKFLFVLPTDILGGAERVAQNLCIFLAESMVDAEIVIYFLTKSKSMDWRAVGNKPNVRLVYGRGKRERNSILDFTKFVIKNNEFKFVYTTHSHTNSLVCFYRSLGLIKLKFLVTRESTVFSDRFFGIKGFLIKSLYKFYGSQDLLICQTDYMKKRLLESVKLSPTLKIETIENPVNLSNIRALANADFEVSRNFNIIIVGRLIPLKNHALLIEALGRLFRNGITDFKLYILGDGPAKTEIERKITDYKLDNNVCFLGRVENPYKVMARADLGVLTSLKEGFPNVIIEMMASGTRNVITTNCAGGLDLLPGITLMDGFDADELATLLKNAITMRFDNSSTYQKFSESRDIASYWNRISDVIELC